MARLSHRRQRGRVRWIADNMEKLRALGRSKLPFLHPTGPIPAYFTPDSITQLELPMASSQPLSSIHSSAPPSLNKPPCPCPWTSLPPPFPLLACLAPCFSLASPLLSCRGAKKSPAQTASEPFAHCLCKVKDKHKHARFRGTSAECLQCTRKPSGPLETQAIKCRFARGAPVGLSLTGVLN